MPLLLYVCFNSPTRLRSHENLKIRVNPQMKEHSVGWWSFSNSRVELPAEDSERYQNCITSEAHWHCSEIINCISTSSLLSILMILISKVVLLLTAKCFYTFQFVTKWYPSCPAIRLSFSIRHDELKTETFIVDKKKKTLDSDRLKHDHHIGSTRNGTRTYTIT